MSPSGQSLRSTRCLSKDQKKPAGRRSNKDRSGGRRTNRGFRPACFKLQIMAIPLPKWAPAAMKPGASGQRSCASKCGVRLSSNRHAVVDSTNVVRRSCLRSSCRSGQQEVNAFSAASMSGWNRCKCAATRNSGRASALGIIAANGHTNQMPIRSWIKSFMNRTRVKIN